MGNFNLIYRIPCLGHIHIGADSRGGRTQRIGLSRLSLRFSRLDTINLHPLENLKVFSRCLVVLVAAVAVVGLVEIDISDRTGRGEEEGEEEDKAVVVVHFPDKNPKGRRQDHI